MYFARVISHQVFFILFCLCFYFYTDFDIAVKVLASLQAYIASYFVSNWIMKAVFICAGAKVKGQNNCVFITGCDSGFGHQSALKLNKLGFKVFATCMDINGKGAKLLMELADDPKKMIIIKMDVTKENEIENAYETVKRSMLYSESLYGLVNNAGISTATELEYGADLNECKKIIDVNLMGMIRVTRQFLPLIRQSKGRIVNMESFGSLISMPHSIYYAVSKSGAAGFTDNLRFEMYRHGVSVVSINPYLYKTAITDTKILRNQYENSFKSSSDEVRKAYGVKFVQKAKIAIMVAHFATKSDAVPNTIVSALTAYEPDIRYIVAPLILQPLLRALLWIPKESLEVMLQVTPWLFSTHKVYPEN